MAIAAADQFAFIGTNNLIARVRGSDLVDRGAWSSVTTYAVNDVATVGGALYLALSSSLNVTPTPVKSASWSPLIRLPPPTGVNNFREFEGRLELRATDGFWYDVLLERSQGFTVMSIGQTGTL